MPLSPRSPPPTPNIPTPSARVGTIFAEDPAPHADHPYLGNGDRSPPTHKTSAADPNLTTYPTLSDQSSPFSHHTDDPWDDDPQEDPKDDAAPGTIFAAPSDHNTYRPRHHDFFPNPTAEPAMAAGTTFAGTTAWAPAVPSLDDERAIIPLPPGPATQPDDLGPGDAAPARRGPGRPPRVLHPQPPASTWAPGQPGNAGPHQRPATSAATPEGADRQSPSADPRGPATYGGRAPYGSRSHLGHPGQGSGQSSAGDDQAPSGDFGPGDAGAAPQDQRREPSGLRPGQRRPATASPPPVQWREGLPHDPPVGSDAWHALQRPAPLDPSQPRRAPPPPAGYRYRMDGQLVPLVDGRLPLHDRDAQDVYCEVLQYTGSDRAAMDAVGCSQRATLDKHLREDPEFAERRSQALTRHRDQLYAAVFERAVHGHVVPVIGGKFKDRVVAYERKYSDSLAALLLKGHFEQFRGADSGPGGAKVIINNNPQANAMANGVPDFSKMTREQRAAMRVILGDAPTQSPPGQGSGQVIDADSTEHALPAGTSPAQEDS